jgi:hypothetical protein
MAVLRHGSLGLPGVTRCDHLIRFEDFARAVADFEHCLKPSGLLVIQHSNFRLCDAAASPAFQTILRLPHNSKTPLFRPDNRLLPEQTYPEHRLSEKAQHLKGLTPRGIPLRAFGPSDQAAAARPPPRPTDRNS